MFGRHRTELRDVRRELAELRAGHADMIELALSAAVPNALHRSVTTARAAGWRLSFHRSEHGEDHRIVLEHPTDSVHNCSIPLPFPDKPDERRKIENHIRMRVGFGQHAA